MPIQILNFGNPVQNYGNVPAMQSGTFAQRPAASAANNGLIYIATDTQAIYQVVGGAWVLIAAVVAASGFVKNLLNAPGIISDTIGNLPNPATNNNVIFLAQDSQQIFQSIGGAWVLIANVFTITANNGITDTGTGLFQLGGVLTLISTYIDTNSRTLIIGYNLGSGYSGGLTINPGFVLEGVNSSTGDARIVYQIGSPGNPNLAYFDLAVTDSGGTRQVGIDTANSGSFTRGMRVLDTTGLLGFFYAADYSAQGLLNNRWLPDLATVKSLIPAVTSYPQIKQTGKLLGQTASVNVFSFAVDATLDLCYRISAFLELTAFTSGSSVLFFTYTDIAGTLINQTLTTGNALGVGNVSPRLINVKHGTNIVLGITVTGTNTSNFGGCIELMF